MNKGVQALNRQRLAAALARRRQVAQLRLAGYRDTEQIATQLGVTPRTIRRDFNWLDQQYTAAAASDTTALRGKQLERIEDAITGIWSDVRAGRWRAITVLVNLLDRQSKLMGLDAPTRVKVDIEAEIRQIAEEQDMDPDELVRIAQTIVGAG